MPRPCGSPLVGLFNVQNALAAAATALAGGFAARRGRSPGLQTPIVVPGRMEPVDGGQPFTVLVDYAHTPDALERLVDGGPPPRAGRRGSSWCSAAAATATRRSAPAWGEAAAAARRRRAHLATTPAPRIPVAIAAAAEAGLRARDADLRGRARPPRARSGPRSARPATGDVVVIAGKGHETGQDSRRGRHARSTTGSSRARSWRRSRGPDPRARSHDHRRWPSGRRPGRDRARLRVRLADARARRRLRRAPGRA